MIMRILVIMMMVMMMMMMMTAYQHIPTSHIPTWWEYVIMMKGGNMTQSHSHHVKIHHLYIDDHFEGK